MTERQEPFYYDGECERYESKLTALFDGEATAAEARAARAHLAACARCAQAWHQWARHRNLLHMEPPPPIPSNLLLRILMACRLSALPRKKVSKPLTWNKPVALEMLPEVQQSLELSVRELDMVAPSTLSSIPTPPVPADLCEAILRRTVHADKMRDEVIVEPVTYAEAGKRSFGWSMARANRMMTALAVPAIVAWVAFANLRPELQVQNTERVAPTSVEVPKIRIAKRAPAVLKRIAAAVTTKPVVSATADIEPAVVTENELNEAEAADAAVSAPRIENPAAKPSAVKPAMPRSVQPAPATSETSADVLANPHLSASPFALASWEPAPKRAVSISRATISRPRAVALPAEPITAIPSRLEAPVRVALATPVADERTDDSHYIGDSRPEVVSHVIDSFRASLIAEAEDLGEATDS